MIAFLSSAATALTLSASLAAAASLVSLSDGPGGQPAAASVKDWAQWTFAFDNAVDGGNPITDATGEFQNRKQTFPVYMVGGVSGGSVERAFTATPGKVFAIPVFNSICLGNSTFGTCVGDEGSREFINDTNRLFLKIDGKKIIDARTRRAVDKIESAFRVDTGIIPLELAPNNWAAEINNFPPLQGSFPESYVDGYFAFVNLRPGTHSLVFRGTSGDVTNAVRTTVTVAPVPVPAALPLLSFGVAALWLAARRRRAVP